MGIQSTTVWTCDGCGAKSNREPSWVKAYHPSGYETNLGYIWTGPSRDELYCHECWRKMRNALAQNQEAGESR